LDGDPTEVFFDDKQWLPMPGVAKGEAWMKVLFVDEERGIVVIKYKFGPNTEVTKHTHLRHAIAYTTAGEWQYGDVKLTEGVMGYEPAGSSHTPISGPGAELFVIVIAPGDEDSDEVRGAAAATHLPDGTELRFDMAFFKMMEKIETPEQLAELAASIEAGGSGY
jgi:hypothetical protein